MLENLPHTDGGCLGPVKLLASNGVTALIVAGIGGRPLAGFKEAGIDVYFDKQLPTVSQAVDAVRAGTVEVIQPRVGLRRLEWLTQSSDKRLAEGLTIAVASGKGGTGKTMVATNLALLVARSGARVTLVDCDVDAPNDHLFFRVDARTETVEVPIPEAPARAVPERL